MIKTAFSHFLFLNSAASEAVTYFNMKRFLSIRALYGGLRSGCMQLPGGRSACSRSARTAPACLLPGGSAESPWVPTPQSPHSFPFTRSRPPMARGANAGGLGGGERGGGNEPPRPRVQGAQPPSSVPAAPAPLPALTRTGLSIAWCKVE